MINIQKAMMSISSSLQMQEDTLPAPHNHPQSISSPVYGSNASQVSVSLTGLTRSVWLLEHACKSWLTYPMPVVGPGSGKEAMYVVSHYQARHRGLVDL